MSPEFDSRVSPTTMDRDASETRPRRSIVRRSRRTAAAGYGIIVLACAFACAEAPTEPKEPPPVLSPSEVERRVDAALELAQLGAEERALGSLELADGETLDSPGRRAFTKAAFEIRRSRFWRDSPLRTSLSLGSRRVRYGESLELVFSFTNLGDENLTVVAFHRSWSDALAFDPGERSILEVSIERHECDAVATRMIERQSLAITLHEDLEIAPGATAEIVASIPIEPRRGMLFGAFAIEAILRPVSIVVGAERRYDPLPFGRAAFEVVRKEIEPWFDAGLAAIDEEIAVAARGRPEALLLAIAGLQEPDLAKGIDRVVRALPGLDPARVRLAQGVLAWCLGREVSGDAVSMVAWWDSEGSRTDPATLRAMRFGRPDKPSHWFAGGIETEPSRDAPLAGSLVDRTTPR